MKGDANDSYQEPGLARGDGGEGIVAGDGDAGVTFRPTDAITRAEAAAMAVRVQPTGQLSGFLGE